METTMRRGIPVSVALEERIEYRDRYGLPVFLGELQDLIGQLTFDASSVFNF